MYGNAYCRFEALPESQRALLFQADIERVSKRAIWSRKEDFACAMLSRQAWDSERLGLEVGKLDLFCSDTISPDTRDDLARSIRAAIHESGLSHFSARIVQEDQAALNVLESIGFKAAGGLLNLAVSIDLGSFADSNPQVFVRDSMPGDERSVRDIASRCFENRLLAESCLDPVRVRDLYGAWAVNDLLGRVPFTMVAIVEGEVTGFCAGGASSIVMPGGSPVGFIDLIVVDNSSRHRGVGQALMVAALQRMRGQGINLVELNVAESNDPAIRLYNHLGFSQRLRFVDLTFWQET
jgi:ribosomal protein S18 acetylase RimI-like enzyme